MSTTGVRDLRGAAQRSRAAREVAHELPRSLDGRDPRIFEIALERLGGIDPSRAVHVGDTPAADCTGAQAAGITPILIDPHNDHEAFQGLRMKSLQEVAELLVPRR